MSTEGRGLTRRGALGAAAGTVAAATAGAGVAAAQEGGDGVDFDGWFENVSNFDGVVDRRGQSEVTVEVGAPGNGGDFAFSPAAIRVDPGTTVVWEWTGNGGGHNVVSQEGSDYAYESELVSEAGFTFEHTFEEEGVSKYYCTPHESLGMKGAVVVGDQGAGPVAVGEPDYEGWFEDVSNFESTVDRRGESEVTVEVGAPGNGGDFAFEPAAVRVDPGTTVVWEWTGNGGGHNVVAEEGTDYAYESELVSDAGFTFEHTFEEEGISEYFCVPHRSLGMKGAVVVGNVGGPPPEEGADLGGVEIALQVFAGGLAALSLPVVIGLAYVWLNRDAYRGPDTGPAMESEEPDTRTVREIGHDEFDPVGTASLVVVYFAILVVLWLFMYFVEFLGNGPTIIG